MVYQCDNCGASIQNVICPYCNSRNGIDLKLDADLKNDSNRVCPSCKISLKTQRISNYKNIYIDKCDECHGIFLDYGELESILKEEIVKSGFKDLRKLQEIQNNPLMLKEEIRYKDCPECQKKMLRINYQKRSGVIIDKCAEHGFWLDGGELRQIMEWAKLEDINSFEPEIKLSSIKVKSSKSRTNNSYHFKQRRVSEYSLIDSIFRSLYGF